MKPALLIVDDEESIRTQLKWALADEYEIHQAGDRVEALKIFEAERPGVIILDLGLPPSADEVGEGLQALTEMLQRNSFAKIIINTGKGEHETAMDAVGNGAYDFLSKPVDLDELKVILRRAFYLSGLESDHRDLRRRIGADGFEGMIGSSPEMLKLFDSIRKVATTDAPVLIEGENGTGKELVAMAVHRLSARAQGPFLPINCGAIPENLLESELFGHEKGAFTGAHVKRQGRIEQAGGGTLLLDEIGELPLALQVKLLRFLQEHTIESVGGRDRIEVDVRVVAATNRDLTEAMREGIFREDLYYRLGVVILRLPPLRERFEDIRLLANYFVQQFDGGGGKRVSGFTAKALAAMERYGWPGNVRELENRIRRAVIMGEGKRLTPADLDLDSIGTVVPGRSLKEARDGFERDLIGRALKRHKGNISRTAEELQVSRPTLYDLMDKLGLEKMPKV